MRYATITAVSPPKAVRPPDTAVVPISNWPAGMTLVIGDVVLVETIGGQVVIVARMAVTS